MASNVKQGSNKSKKFCRLCCQHNVNSLRSQHICPYENCNCKQCRIIQLQRKIMKQQMQLRRINCKITKTHNSNDEISSKYLCQLCKNHGIQIVKKNHFDCPNVECVCELCSLTKARSYVEVEVKRFCRSSPRLVGKRLVKQPIKRLTEGMFDKMHEIFMIPNEPIQQSNNSTDTQNISSHHLNPAHF